MKTYFMAWQCDNKRGHCTADAPEDMHPTEVLKQMIESVKQEFGPELIGFVSANQFNVVG